MDRNDGLGIGLLAFGGVLIAYGTGMLDFLFQPGVKPPTEGEQALISFENGSAVNGEECPL